jgi:hypothetical protein
MRSADDAIGLALLRLDAVVERRKLTVDAATLDPVHPDWMRRPGQSQEER